MATSAGRKPFVLMVLASHDRWEVQAYVSEEDVVKIARACRQRSFYWLRGPGFTGRVSSVGAEARFE